jgi:hypothetical protein
VKNMSTELAGTRSALTESNSKLDTAIAKITSLLDQIGISNAATADAREETRLAREQTALLRAEIHSVHEEVKTGNALTLGALADNAETRRIAALPEHERTAAELEHVDKVGIQGSVKPGEGSGDAKNDSPQEKAESEK